MVVWMVQVGGLGLTWRAAVSLSLGLMLAGLAVGMREEVGVEGFMVWVERG